MALEGGDFTNLIMAIGRIEGKVEAIMINHDNVIKDIKEAEVRLNRLEQYRAWLLGAVAMISAISTIVFSYLLKLFN